MPRIFSIEDQHAFALLSGDYNPIHVDPIAARRLLFGRPVVHGMHAALWAIDRWLQTRSDPIRLTRIFINFRAPLFVGEPADWALNRENVNSARLDVSHAGALVLSVELQYEIATINAASVSAPSPLKQPCRDRSPADCQSATGRLELWLDPELAAKLLPNAVRNLPAPQLAMLLCTTRLVGMEMPGEHSLFMKLDLKSGDENHADLQYRAGKFDTRFSTLTLHVAGADLHGEISAAFRPPPTRQIAFADLQPIVRPDEFSGERALVIGGSRGLGEVAVKALAAGGADVKFTFHRGAQDAGRVVAELAGAGKTIESFAYDVGQTRSARHTLAAVESGHIAPFFADWHPTLLCYFATPYIAAGKASRFAPELYADYCGYYVDGFLRAFQALHAAGSLRKILYPSSIFVEEPPAGMAEYAAAKLAGEGVCRVLARMHPEISFHVPRFPRLATDQTARRTLLPAKSADAADAVVKALREIMSASGLRYSSQTCQGA